MTRAFTHTAAAVAALLIALGTVVPVATVSPMQFGGAVTPVLA